MMVGLLSLLAPYKLFLEAGALIALVVGAFFYGHAHGAAGVQAKWDVAENARQAAEWKRSQDNDKRSYDASSAYEVAAATIKDNHAYAATKRKAALLAPAVTECAKTPTLGDVRIYGAILDSLRSASGTDRIQGQPTTSGLGETMQPRP